MRFLILYLLIMSSQASLGSSLYRWDFVATDVIERKVTSAQIKGHVTALSFGTRSTRDQAEKLGQFIGDAFGASYGFQSIALINISQMPFFIKPIAASIIKSSFEDEVDEAIEKQMDGGVESTTRERVLSRMYFVNDSEGDLWRRFGADPESDAFYFGILDSKGRLIYMAKNPADYQDIRRIMDRELTKLETTVSRK